LSEKAITRMQALAVIILVVAIAAGFIIAPQLTLGPGGGSDGSNDNGSNGTGNGAGQPDLKISNIGTEPYPPQVGELFFIQVRVTNIGEAKSGSYKLDVLVNDKANQISYVVALKVDQSPLESGEYRLWDKWIAVGQELKYEGYHTLYALITPVGFEDGDNSNNIFESSPLWVSKP
jgi:hypothetical protein